MNITIYGWSTKRAPSFYLDLAHAHAVLRHDAEAIGVLEHLRQRRPEWLPKQRYAADILQKIIHRRRTLNLEIRKLADALR